MDNEQRKLELIQLTDQFISDYESGYSLSYLERALFNTELMSKYSGLNQQVRDFLPHAPRSDVSCFRKYFHLFDTCQHLLDEFHFSLDALNVESKGWQ